MSEVLRLAEVMDRRALAANLAARLQDSEAARSAERLVADAQKIFEFLKAVDD